MICECGFLANFIENCGWTIVFFFLCYTYLLFND